MAEQCSTRCFGLILAVLGGGARPRPPNKTTIAFKNNTNNDIQISTNGRVITVLKPGQQSKTFPATVGQIFLVNGQPLTAVQGHNQINVDGKRAAPNVANIRLYPLAHNRAVGGLRSIDSKTAASITFTNRTSNVVNIDWINYSGQRQRYRTLKSGEEYRQETFIGHPWEVAVEGRTTRFLPTAGSEYHAVIGSTDNPTLVRIRGCDSANLRSTDGGAATAINFFNGSNGDARIFWTDRNGNRQHYQTLKPGEMHHQHTFLNHPWEVVASQNTTRYMPIDAEADVCIE